MEVIATEMISAFLCHICLPACVLCPIKLERLNEQNNHIAIHEGKAIARNLLQQTFQYDNLLLERTYFIAWPTL